LRKQVETPGNMRASVRFAKYRGLKSWRTSTWDPREELPPEYARVFAFENFRRARKRCVAAVAAVLMAQLSPLVD
jgi:pre-rRNA-processing protein TSR1